jgi:hypothetical protein
MGWTWVTLDLLFKGSKCKTDPAYCEACLLGKPEGKAGLLWIGGCYYQDPSAWTDEASRLGVSRRISRLPRGFKLGETVVLVAHRKGYKYHSGQTGPGVFSAFRPTAIEYVVTDKETQDQLSALERRGVTPVKVVRDGHLPQIDDEAKA